MRRLDSYLLLRLSRVVVTAVGRIYSTERESVLIVLFHIVLLDLMLLLVE